MLQSGTSWELAKLLIAPLLAALAGYLVGAFTKVSKIEHQKALEAQERHWQEKFAALEKVIEKQSERNSKFEAALSDKVSKAELKEAVTEVKLAVQEMRAEFREDFKQLQAAIDRRT